MLSLLQHKASCYSQSVIEDLKASICMNNYGIVMIEQQLYHEACVCFHLSMEGIRNICSFLEKKQANDSSCCDMISSTTSSSSSWDKIQYNDNYDIRMMMDGARKLCCNETNGATAATTTTTTATGNVSKSCCCPTGSTRSSNIGVQRINCVFTFNQQTLNYPSSCSTMIKSDDVVHPIWINDLTFHEIINDPCMAFAIVAYNFAIAKRCNLYTKLCNNTLTCSNDDEMLREISEQISLLTLADRILSDRLCTGRMIEKLFVVYTSSIILSSFIYTISSYNWYCTTSINDDRNNCNKIDIGAINCKLYRVERFIARLKAIYPIGNMWQTPASAA